MKRTSKKAQEIAWDLLGKPGSFIYKKTRKQKERDKLLNNRQPKRGY